MSFSGDLRKVRKRAREQGWRIAGTPSSPRSWTNFLADLKRKGYRP